MGHLHDAVAAGKVLYLGASDAPAWAVAQANTWATLHGKTPFAVYQGEWSVLARGLEREVVPMAREWGMALAPWGVLAGGRLRSDAEEARRRASGERGRVFSAGQWERTPAERAMGAALEHVAREIGGGCSLTAVAIAYVMHKTAYVFPVVGGRKIEHLEDNIKALDVALTKDQIAYIERVSVFDPGFPTNMIGDGTEPNQFYVRTGHVDRVQFAQPILPRRPELA